MEAWQFYASPCSCGVFYLPTGGVEVEMFGIQDRLKPFFTTILFPPFLFSGQLQIPHNPLHFALFVLISKEKEVTSAAAIYVLLYCFCFVFHFDFQKQLQGLKETWEDQGNSMMQHIDTQIVARSPLNKLLLSLTCLICHDSFMSNI